MARLQPYPTYKDSGIEWLGEVPSHWETRRLKSLTCNVSEQTFEHPKGIGYIALEHVESWTGRIANEGAEAGDGLLKRFEPGDVLFGKLRPYLAKVVHVTFLGLCVGEFLVLRARMGISPRFLEYILRSKAAIDWINSSTFGARMPRTDWAFVGDMRLPLPPLSAQTAIARFLDHATSRIERYIRAKEKLIALLEEQKQVLVHDAVTGRIDVRTGKPYPAYKPSGVEWLGDVPAHWEVRRLGQLGTLLKGRGGTKADEVSKGVPCIRYGDLYTTHSYAIRKSRSCVSQERATEYTYTQFGDVLFAASGESIAEIGKSAVNLIRSEVCCGGDVILFRPRRPLDPRFMGYAADSQTAMEQKARMGRGFTVVHIYPHQIKRIGIALPPLSEQTAIARFLDRGIADTAKTIECTNRDIDLLREYRTRLIADVVTGKVDIREAAAELPDTNAIAWEDGTDTIQAESHSHRAEHSIAEEANP